MPAQDFCAIDFGTSNSAIAIPASAGAYVCAGASPTEKRAMQLVQLEPGFQSMPTAVFYNAEDESRCFGREAVLAYVDGYDGRLMRSIKSILGSDLMDQTTEIGHGITIKYIDVVIGYLKHLKRVAEQQHGAALHRAIIGRPVWFVDGDPARDRQAQASLETAGHAAGFTDVAFQFEPIAAALDYESTISEEQMVLVVDIGGGTSDFSLVRVGPARHAALDRQDDILANHGIHVAGTDFDQSVNLAAIMPQLGYGSRGPARAGHAGRRVPGKIYFDLATWHLINTAYAHNRVIELRQMASMYAEQAKFARLINVVTKRLGHQLAALAEQAKIDVATNGNAVIDLAIVEEMLAAAFSDTAQADALDHQVQRIVGAAKETLQQAGVGTAKVSAVYFTGGSTGLGFLTHRIAELFPNAKRVTGDRFSSVASGLGIYAQRWFGQDSGADAGPQAAKQVAKNVAKNAT